HFVMEVVDKVKLQGVRKRSVTDVVQQHSNKRALIFGRTDGGILFAQVIQGTLGQFHSAQGMGETRVLRGGENQIAQSHLLDAPQPLHIWMINEFENGSLGNGDKAVDGIVEYL